MRTASAAAPPFVPVRLILGISLMLLGLGTLLCQVDVLNARATPVAPASNWVRTADGWERPASWQSDAPPAPEVHPLLLATGQTLASVLALVAFQADARRRFRWKCC